MRSTCAGGSGQCEQALRLLTLSAPGSGQCEQARKVVSVDSLWSWTQSGTEITWTQNSGFGNQTTEQHSYAIEPKGWNMTFWLQNKKFWRGTGLGVSTPSTAFPRQLSKLSNPALRDRRLTYNTKQLQRWATVEKNQNGNLLKNFQKRFKAIQVYIFQLPPSFFQQWICVLCFEVDKVS